MCYGIWYKPNKDLLIQNNTYPMMKFGIVKLNECVYQESHTLGTAFLLTFEWTEKIPTTKHGRESIKLINNVKAEYLLSMNILNLVLKVHPT